MGIKIKKYSGELIDFDVEKLKYSLSRSGASEIEIEEVLDKMQPQIHDGMTTKTIYQLAFNQLKKVSGTLAARYSLKRALLDLGPAGFYFEQWVAKFLQNYGYETLNNEIVQGEAVTHEADVIAKRGKDLFWIECKFKNTISSKITVTTPMYLLSRIKDISVRSYNFFGKEEKITQGWLITNVYLTSDAVAFGEYYGIKMLSWDYPINRSIKHLVDQKALYPITCLTSLSKREKEYLLSKGYILVKDLHNQIGLGEKQDLFENNLLNKRNKSKIMAEVEGLIHEFN